MNINLLPRCCTVLCTLWCCQFWITISFYSVENVQNSRNWLFLFSFSYSQLNNWIHVLNTSFVISVLFSSEIWLFKSVKRFLYVVRFFSILFSFFFLFRFWIQIDWIPNFFFLCVVLVSSKKKFFVSFLFIAISCWNITYKQGLLMFYVFSITMSWNY